MNPGLGSTRTSRPHTVSRRCCRSRPRTNPPQQPCTKPGPAVPTRTSRPHTGSRVCWPVLGRERTRRGERARNPGPADENVPCGRTQVEAVLPVPAANEPAGASAHAAWPGFDENVPPHTGSRRCCRVPAANEPAGAFVTRPHRQTSIVLAVAYGRSMSHPVPETKLPCAFRALVQGVAFDAEYDLRAGRRGRAAHCVRRTETRVAIGHQHARAGAARQKKSSGSSPANAG